MFCAHCGREVEYGIPYCPYCGTKQVSKKQSLANRMVGGVANQVENVLGGGRHVELEFSHFFSEVRRRHTKDEAEKIFIYGTSTTTPPIQQAGYLWRRPWLYSRVLGILLLSLAILLLVLYVFNSINALPGVILLGSFAVPFSTLVFFYEMNVPRNISFLEVLEDFFMGGVTSILATFLLALFIPGSGVEEFFPAMLTGIIEEVAKLVVVILVMHRSTEGRYILNGMLFGAAIGAGFASFETAGYALSCLFLDSASDMMETIVLRGILAIGSHVAWTAVSGAALAIALNRGPVTAKFILRPIFWGLFAIPVLCHGIWDWIPLFSCIPLVFVIWIILLVLIRRGFVEVNTVSRAAKMGATSF